MITVARPEDRKAVVDALVVAFEQDPVLRYLFPDDETYPRYAAAFFGVCFDKRVHQRTVWTIHDGAATAMWEPPQVEHPDDNLAGEFPEDVLKRVRAYDEAVHAALPKEPFWYLGVLGTHPDFAGRRWAQAVMHAGLDRAEADGLPAILETSKPANVEFYRKAGWRVVNEIADPLPVWVMRR
ncbi:GNAT family N-acetyltransferase [Paractinoplanes lichenicola]|uniref:GNAT family N-acetyltransferase n=1 Tax=Paractinoplanes lichenicola TaxID=2802976 RepID=A0ABS1VTK0_9ACTN|nr:GNAT family N-acetyltransferase [Actinoplanes lichenicola]MBL7257795.1 GNAT family N-acetyltransferase [Actinoplanes lichenicola]